MEMTTSWHEKGKQEGRQEGSFIASRKFIGKYLRARFGADASKLTAKINELTELELLESVSEMLFTAESYMEAETMIEEALHKQSINNK